MRIPPSFTRYAAVAAFLAAAPAAASAQTALEAYYAWSTGFSNYATYGSGSADKLVVGGAADLHSWIVTPIGGGYNGGSGKTAGTYGALTAASSVFANANGLSIWNSSSATMYSQMYFRDYITITSDGSLDFSLLMGDVMSMTVPATPTCGASYSPYFGGGQCMRTAAKLDVVGAINSHIQTGNTTLATGPSSVMSGPIAVHTGDMFEMHGYLMVGGRVCEDWNGTPCTLADGTGSSGDAQGWANFYIGSSGGAAFTSQSGASYAVSVVATPEPATMALMGTGLLGIMGFARRRNSAV